MSLLLSKAYLSLEMANRMADKVVSTAKANNFAPITVFVLDSAGSTITQQRMDLCPQVGAEKFAFAKAYTCIATKMFESIAINLLDSCTNKIFKLTQVIEII